MPIIRAYKNLPPERKFNLWRRIWRSIIGFTVILFGLILSIPGIPGPGIVVIILGLAVLATEYAWARHSLNKLKESGRKLGSIFFPPRKKEASSAEDKKL
jgi:hypothetical protein